MDDNKMTLYQNMSEAVHKLLVNYKLVYGDSSRMPGVKKMTPIESEVLNLLEWNKSISVKDIILILARPAVLLPAQSTDSKTRVL